MVTLNEIADIILDGLKLKGIDTKAVDMRAPDDDLVSMSMEFMDFNNCESTEIAQYFLQELLQNNPSQIEFHGLRKCDSFPTSLLSNEKIIIRKVEGECCGRKLVSIDVLIKFTRGETKNAS